MWMHLIGQILRNNKMATKGAQPNAFLTRSGAANAEGPTPAQYRVLESTAITISWLNNTGQLHQQHKADAHKYIRT